MKIYTKKGDKGKTSLIGGVKVSKSNIRIDAYGTVDELNSVIGVVRDLYTNEPATSVLLSIQNQLFNIGSHLAAHPEKSIMKLPGINESDITLLEKEMDRMNLTLPALMNFILPGGNIASSQCHVARCVCRRAERITVALSEHEMVEPVIMKYLNRLSDYLFVLARQINADNNAKEILWNSK